ncbi:hypothetical protein KJ766_01030 [Patescibacteria group bacterium]|nr:hypothetical protein [Patescibacteria group bacterium]
MEHKLLQYEELQKKLEIEVSRLQDSLSNVTTLLSEVKRELFESMKTIISQNSEIEVLNTQFDSLIKIVQHQKEEEIVTNPATEEDSIIYIIQSYYAAKKWEDRLNYVLKPEAVRSQMEATYSKKYEPYRLKKENVSISGSNFSNNDIFEVEVEGQVTFYCKKIDNTFKIDWLATKGYNQVPFNVFKVDFNSPPTTFRVIASLGSLYLFNYDHAQKTHWNIRVSDNNKDGLNTCYVSRTSTEGKKIYEILNDGKRHNLIIEIKHDPASTDTYVITKLIQQGWSLE